jgi:hypothetical protein
MIHHICENLFLSYPVDMLDHSNTESMIQWDEQAVEAIT